MSMLAERKIKQKWSLNPRGKAWSEDSSKFGQKMLEKMGWSSGKGLGAKEDGITEHVKLPYKNDSKGMGYKETNDQWTEHDSNFNALLESLSGQKVDESVKIAASLEKKSQSSRVRVHYKKFTRGKDLSRCSEKDLANIFGKKSLKKSPKPPEIEDSLNHQNGGSMPPPGIQEDSSNDHFTRNGGSMVDYFKKKIPNFGKVNGYVIGNNGVLKKGSDSEDEAYSGFGFGFKSPLKRKSEEEMGNETPKKVKGGEGFSNPGFDPLFNNVQVQKHVLNTIEEEDEEKKMNGVISTSVVDFENNSEAANKKKKNKYVTDNPSFDLQNGEESYVDENFEVNRKKKKKKEKTSTDNRNFGDKNEMYEKKREQKSEDLLAIDNPNFDDKNQSQDSFTNETFEVKRKQKKKKDKKLEDSLAITNPSFGDENQSQNININENYEVKRKKKKEKTQQEESFALNNPIFDDKNESQNSYINENYEVKRKKKKHKKFLAIDNPNFDEENGSQDSYINETYEVKRKKKKEKKTEESLAIDNPNFDDKNESQDSYMNETYEVKRKKKKEKKQEESLAIDNPNFDDKNESQDSFMNESYELKRKKKKNKVVDDKSPEDKSISKSEIEINEPTFDLILNVTSTPSLPLPKQNTPKTSIKRRKSVRFSNVNEERIIPSKEDIANRNELFEINSKVIASNLLEENEFSKRIEGFQAEIENDINEQKTLRYVGEVGNPDGENEKLPDGTRLKFKYANFGKTPIWVKKNSASRSKSSYKHLIKGDIIVGFQNTNLDEIKGYGCDNQNQ